MAEELTPVARDIEGLTRAIGAVINPLAQQQGETQKRAIDADVEKYRIATDAGKQRTKFGFTLSFTLLLIVAGVVAASISSPSTHWYLPVDSREATELGVPGSDRDTRLKVAGAVVTVAAVAVNFAQLNAEIPVWARPSTSACMSWVPSSVFTVSRLSRCRIT
jgi:hypothetical protein